MPTPSPAVLKVAWLVFGYEYHFIDGVNLAFHEAGHLFFSFFGQTIQFLGGTIGQLFFPAACCVHFIRREQSVEAAICCIWFAESLMYTARYLADAQALALPLVGGQIHDWNWLLSRAGLLGHCETIGTLLHVLASMVAIAAFSVETGLADVEYIRDALTEVIPTYRHKLLEMDSKGLEAGVKLAGKAAQSVVARGAGGAIDVASIPTATADRCFRIESTADYIFANSGSATA